MEILKGLRDRYEAHHRVEIRDSALRMAVELSNRYITGRVQPDKAIDVIDEAGARIRLKNMTKPPDLASTESEIERLQREKDEAVRNADYERAALLRDEAEQKRAGKDEMLKAWKEESREVSGIVDEEVIAEVVSKMTGVPLTRLEAKEAQRLLELEQELHKRVVSQDEAIVAVSTVSHFSKTVELNPSSAIDYANLGVNYRRLEKNDEAIKYFELALSLDPTIEFAKDNLAQLFSMTA